MTSLKILIPAGAPAISANLTGHGLPLGPTCMWSLMEGFVHACVAGRQRIINSLTPSSLGREFGLTMCAHLFRLSMRPGRRVILSRKATKHQAQMRSRRVCIVGPMTEYILSPYVDTMDLLAGGMAFINSNNVCVA
jgi:hypothetical protein